MQKVSTLRLVLSASAFFLFTSCSGTRGPRVLGAPPRIVKPRVSSGSNKFIRPLSTKYTITQRFKPKKNPKHKGMDLAGKKGTPIFSVGHGRVVYRGRRFSGYGNMVLIEHAGGVSTLYSHMSKMFVKIGQKVKPGTLLGTMGKTGRATGVHLHFEIMENKTPVNPEKYIRF